MRRRPIRTSFGWSLIATCLALALPASASAEAKLGISPLKVNLSGKAGSTLTTTVSLSAQGDEALSIRFAHLDFGLTDSYSIVLIDDAAPETTSFSTRNWFSVKKQRFRIPAGATVQVPVTIKIPRNTPGGTYLGIASFVSSSDSAQGGQIRTSVAAGTELFIAVEGGSPPKPDITKLEVPRFVTKGPIRPKLSVTNRGDEFFTLQGSIRIDGATKDGAKVEEQYVLADQPRTIRTSTTKDTDAERRQAALVVGTSALGIGRHELEVRLRINPTNSTLVARRTFWVVPVWAWIVLPLVALVLLAGAAWGTVIGVRLLRARGHADADTVAPEAVVDPHAGAYDGVLGIEPSAGVEHVDHEEYVVDEDSDDLVEDALVEDDGVDDVDFSSHD